MLIVDYFVKSVPDFGVFMSYYHFLMLWEFGL